MNGILYWRSFYREHLTNILVTSSLFDKYQLEFDTTYFQQATSGHRIASFLTSFNLSWCYCVLKYRNNESKSKQHVNETPFKIFFLDK